MSEEEPEIKLNDQVKELKDEVNELYPNGTVLVQFHGQKSGWVRHDQAEQKSLPGGIAIIVTDLTEPNYTASHELLHVLMLLKGFPQIFFDLSLGDQEMDEQMMILSTNLYDIAMHRVVVAEQRKHDLINERIEDEYMEGIRQTLTDEPEDESKDNERTLRLITLTDALVFFGKHADKYVPELEKRYPVAMAAAEKFYAKITAKPIKDPFDMRRCVVNIYKWFDEQMGDWGLPALHNDKFTTLDPVLSARQLRLEVRQVFAIYDSQMKSRHHGNKKVYCGVMRSDGQTSFTMLAPNPDTPQMFQKIYSEPVEKLLKDQHVPYTVRK